MTSDSGTKGNTKAEYTGWLVAIFSYIYVNIGDLR